MAVEGKVIALEEPPAEGLVVALLLLVVLVEAMLREKPDAGPPGFSPLL